MRGKVVKVAIFIVIATTFFMIGIAVAGKHVPSE